MDDAYQEAANGQEGSRDSIEGDFNYSEEGASDNIFMVDGEEEDEEDTGMGHDPNKRRRVQEGGSSLREMMLAVDQMNAEADAKYVPPAVLFGGTPEMPHRTYHGDNHLAVNPFVALEASELELE